MKNTYKSLIIGIVLGLAGCVVSDNGVQYQHMLQYQQCWNECEKQDGIKNFKPKPPLDWKGAIVCECNNTPPPPVTDKRD